VALEGIGLIGRNLELAFHNGSNLEARTHIARGSMYGGMCLGPVNTAAIHALAYPLGNMYKIPHGMSVAVLLPYVLEYNLDYATDKLAEVSNALGVATSGTPKERALEGIALIRQIIRSCQLPLSLSLLKIPRSDLPVLAGSAFTVQRLLKNNVRDLSIEDISVIYKNAFDEV
jgi:alcohol dehydrogenase class IV